VLISFYDTERANEILDSFYKLTGEYIQTVNRVFSRFAEVAGPQQSQLPAPFGVGVDTTPG
jgi:hypothetical protein